MPPCATGVPPLSSLQERKRNMKQSNTAGVQIQTMLELKHYCIPLQLPEELAALSLSESGDLLRLPAPFASPAAITMASPPPSAGPSSSPLTASLVDKKLLCIPMDATAFQVEGATFTGRMQIHWMSQLMRMPRKFVLHADGKHKLHHGEWVLLTLGTHTLRWDAHHHTLSTTFVPLVYLFCKQHESEGACLLLMRSLQAVCRQYFGGELEPGAVMSDHAPAFRNAYSQVWPDAPFGQCWPHIARKWREGAWCSKTWEHFEEVAGHLFDIHHARSRGMCDLLIREFGKLWDTWGTQMNTFWDSYCVAPWDCWSIGLFECPMCTPSQQVQESWHKQLMIKKIPGMFRASTEYVFAVTLPQLVEMDAIELPTELCFEVPAVPKEMMQDALWYVDHQTTHVHAFRAGDGDVSYLVLRKGNEASDKITKKLIRIFEAAIDGQFHSDLKGKLEDLRKVCQCMHYLFPANASWGHVEAPFYNPTQHVCTCKTCRLYGICKHILAINHILKKVNVRYELRTIGKSAAGTKGGGNGMRPVPALTRAPAPQPDSSDEEWERLVEQGNQGK